MAHLHPRAAATLFLLFATTAIFLLCRFLALHSKRPIAIWGAGGYLAMLHLVALYGILSSQLFSNGIAQLTLLTFPFSMSLFDSTNLAGFGTLHELAANYARYIVCFGGFNTLLLAAFLVLATPPRRRTPPLTLPDTR